MPLIDVISGLDIHRKVRVVRRANVFDGGNIEQKRNIITISSVCSFLMFYF